MVFVPSGQGEEGLAISIRVQMRGGICPSYCPGAQCTPSRSKGLEALAEIASKEKTTPREAARISSKSQVFVKRNISIERRT